LDPCSLVGIVDVVPPYFGSLTIHAKHYVILVRIPFFTDFLYIVIDVLIKRRNKHLVICDVINGHIYIFNSPFKVELNVNLVISELGFGLNDKLSIPDL
jgi:hypothetical protein